MNKVFFFLALGLGLNLVSCATNKTKTTEPSLVIKVGGQTREFSRFELLHSPLVKKLQVAKDPAYPRKKITYSVVPIASLFDGMNVDLEGTMLFICRDGFSAPISTTRLLNKDQANAVAYLAIEPADEKWPVLKSGQTAGPFYLVWEHPEKSKIGTEEWPFQLASFELRPAIEKQFPDTVPDLKLPESGPVRQGYKAFMKNCFSCHTLNNNGASQMGPDLNIPANPTEYMKQVYLEKLIRDPQQVRHWPQSKMRGFKAADLSDSELHNIISYLRHMAGRKVIVKAK